MGVEMLMKGLEAFSGKALRSAERVIMAMAANSISDSELSEHNKGSNSSEPQEAGRSPRRGARKAAPGQARGRGRPAKSPFMAPGEGEISRNLKCNCGGDIYIEALCGRAAVEEKCLRIANCMSCKSVIKIR